MQNLTINFEYEQLIQPLTQDEYNQRSGWEIFGNDVEKFNNDCVVNNIKQK